jgi:hypothetical protein
MALVANEKQVATEVLEEAASSETEVRELFRVAHHIGFELYVDHINPKRTLHSI